MPRYSATEIDSARLLIAGHARGLPIDPRHLEHAYRVISNG